MTNPFDMSDDEFLDCLGPSWRGMSPAELADYPHSYTPPDEQPAPVLRVLRTEYPNAPTAQTSQGLAALAKFNARRAP